MTRWQWSSNLDFALTLATVAVVTSVCLATVATGCPEPCQCTQTYYVYCQRIGLTSENILEVVTAVPYEALLLDLSSNALDRLNSGVFDSVPNLEYLFLDNNQVHTVGLSVFHHQNSLRELSLKNNKLTEVGAGVFANMSNLRKLHLDQNGIERIEARSFSLPALRELYLQKNKLTVLGPSQLYGFRSLQVLDLSDNQIQTIEVGAFQDLPSLQTLHMSRNRLSSLAENVFQGLSSLKELHLDGNMLPSLDCFDVPNFANTLHNLVLSNNSLVAVPHDVFTKLRSLRILTLDHNRIASVGQQAFKDLQLDNLTIAHNYLETINRDMLDATRRISRLDLSHNRIHTIRTGAFDSFRESVYVLNLAGNKLGTIDHGMFRGMSNLLSLNLSSNALWSILDGSFKEVVQLDHLDLDHNRLQWLSADLLQGPSLERLSVLDNPIKELRGFTFDDVDHPVKVLVNLTLQSSTMRSVTVAWPYRQGAQLYWTLRLWCFPHNSTDSSCVSPLVESSISPNKVTETVVGLQPGTDYFVCVDPTFLSKDIHVSQCGRVSTLRNQPTTLRPQEPESHTSNVAHPQKVDSHVLWTCVFVVVMLTSVYPVLWIDTQRLISCNRRLTRSPTVLDSVTAGDGGFAR